VLCIDLGGTNLRYGIINRRGELKNFSILTLSNDDKSEQSIIKILWEIIRAGKADVDSIGIAIPGFIYFDKDVVVSSPNFPDWRNFRIRKILMEKVQLPVLVENDANAFAIGEAWKGAGKEFKNFVGITLGTGVGGGIILNRKIWHGSRGSAGEIGHITVEPEGVKCNCGARGCLEMFASAQAVIREAKRAFKNMIKGYKKDEISKKIFEMAKAGDEDAKRIFEDVGYYIGIAIADIANLLNIEGVVIGGGLSNAWEFIYPAIKREASYRINPVSRTGLKILRAKLGDYAGLYGMAVLGLQLFKEC
jgi:glucokinase